MVLGIILIIAAIIGIIYGIAKKRTILAIVSAITLLLLAAIGLYVLKNPY